MGFRCGGYLGSIVRSGFGVLGRAIEHLGSLISLPKGKLSISRGGKVAGNVILGCVPWRERVAVAFGNSKSTWSLESSNLHARKGKLTDSWKIWPKITGIM